VIDKERVEILINDIEYLKYEAQSITQVIESVPYSEKPLDGTSILEIFLTIDSIQAKLLDIFSQIPLKGNKVEIEEQSLFKKVEIESDLLKEIHFSEVAKDIENNRVDLCSKILNYSPEFLEVQFNLDSKQITIFDLLTNMVRKERALLKEVADLVLTFQTDKQFQREIAGRNVKMS